MITITQAIEEIVAADNFIQEVMQQGILNVSAYGKLIHKKVEEKTFKTVAFGTLVVSLTRVMKKLQQEESFCPAVAISSISVISSLSEITYDRRGKNIVRLLATEQERSSSDFFTMTEGPHEVTIICTKQRKQEILKHIQQKPIVVLDSLVAVSVRFSDEYTTVPNIFYTLIRALAIRRINILEIVSTYTQLSFIVSESVMEKTLHALQRLEQKSK